MPAMIVIFTGDGKGKTTAALGQMVRAAGRGKNVLMIQFIKGPWRSGEDDFAEHCVPATRMDADDNPSTALGAGADTRGYVLGTARFEIRKMGLGFVGILGDKLPCEEHAKAAERALQAFRDELAAGRWYLIVLDEANTALSLGLLKVADVLEAIKRVPEDRLVILTGRGAPPELIAAADLVTEMKEIKHPFAKGESAKKGIEF